MRAYQLQTSQILQVIRATQREWAAQKVPSLEPMTGDGPPVFVDPAVERQRLVERAQLESDERLEERYHESKRAAFQAEYDQQEAEFQRYIDKDARAYAALFDTPMFKVAEQYDYDGDHRESGVAYAKTMALCLGGSITEAVASDVSPAAGTSETLWQKWLQDPDSPPYRALLMRDRALLAGLLPSFSDVTNWNDSDKLYGMLSKIIASDDAGLRMRNTLKQAIAETQGALNAASQLLSPNLPPGIQTAVRHLNSATQFLYNGVNLIELEVKMKLGEYYALQSAHLRELQHKANASIAEARDRMHRNIADIDIHSTKAWNKVRPIIQHGLMSLAVLDPRFTNTMISVSVWVEGTAADVHGRLFEEANMKVAQASSLAQRTLVEVSVAAGTLESNARKVLQGMRITSQQAAQLVRTGFRGLRGVAGSWEVLLAIGGLYLQSDSLARNQEKAEAEIGPKAYEAKLALQGSLLGILGGQIELIGLITRSGAGNIHRPWAKGAAVTGQAIIKIGAVLSTVAGVFDTAQAILARQRTLATGDSTAARQYRIAVSAYGLGTVAFAFAVFRPLVFGPLGLAVTLTLVAYEFSKRAENNESTALERWARRCYFGLANETPSIHWNAPEFSDIAFAELNAATLGVQARLNFESSMATDPTLPRIGGLVSLNTVQQLKFLVALPKFNKAKSAYRWKLIAHRVGDGAFPDYVGGESIASGDYFSHPIRPLSPSSSFSKFTPPRHPDYVSDFSTDEYQRPYPSEDGGVYQLEISGVVPLAPTIGSHSLSAATLLVMYWPDRNLPDAYIEVCSRGMNE